MCMLHSNIPQSLQIGNSEAPVLISRNREEGRPPQQGSIVNCASVNSIQAGPGTTGYTAAKHSVNGITKAVSSLPYTLRPVTANDFYEAALEARQHNIRVNSVSPGFLRTQLFSSVTTKGAGDVLESKSWGEYEARQGRKAHPDEVGDVVVLLSTPRFSLVNGHNLVIDG